MRVLKSALLVSLCSLALADDPGQRLQDFQHLIEFSTDAHAGQLVRLPVPDTVYQLSQQGLADLQVFNAAGQALAHQIMDIPTRSQANRVQITPQIYYVPRPVRDSRQEWSLALELDNNQRLSWRTQGTQSVDNVIILDLGQQLQTDWRFLELQLTPTASQQNISRDFQLESSQDLNNWSSLGQHSFTYLADQPSGNIALSQAAQRFVRITWPDTQAIELDSAQVLLQPTSVRRADLVELTINSQQSTGQGTTWVYPLVASASIQALNVDLSPGDALSARLVGVTPDRLRQNLGSHEFFNQPQQNRRNSDLVFNNRQLASLELISPRRLLSAPALRLQIVPQQLVIALEGEPPFRLALGHHWSPYSLSQPIATGLSLATLEGLTLATAHQPVANSQYRAKGRSNLQWLGLGALWLAIAGALIALVVILHQLAKQMKQKD